jgi:molybdopterin-guanine dinucleotide biosynthesis protein A
MTGVVLCGGQSVRMKTDKGLIPLNGLTWVQTAFNKLAEFKMPVFVSINTGQLLEYEKTFDASILMQDSVSLPCKGLLLGLLSVHQKLPQSDLLVLACDMPLMESFILHKLVSAHQN